MGYIWSSSCSQIASIDKLCGQIPPEVTDPESGLYNRGSCWIMGGKLSIARAFAEQSKADFQKFLHSRGTELAPGGILQCYLSGRKDLADPTNQTIPERRHRFLAGPDFESAWDDLLAEVTIDHNLTKPQLIQFSYTMAEHG